MWKHEHFARASIHLVSEYVFFHGVVHVCLTCVAFGKKKKFGNEECFLGVEK